MEQCKPVASEESGASRMKSFSNVNQSICYNLIFPQKNYVPSFSWTLSCSNIPEPGLLVSQFSDPPTLMSGTKMFRLFMPYFWHRMLFESAKHLLTPMQLLLTPILAVSIESFLDFFIRRYRESHLPIFCPAIICSSLSGSFTFAHGSNLIIKCILPKS